ncbi:protein-L-isoaspartate O-methyltransferas-like protein [Hyaloscypha variabilis F]|uniref:protein-L-isoaspartate(D-aspartate) O-methyltransferase n=1 Tax=Hyaloscypha variabilis (strain UAMH 11265 / GT02V1 / F) TaxID=1149755 RepID=A0A2J6RVI4_HYAVF|nr:protein-L-isoaspartate O-methyltransferas-like protein [Hyaloscypha variabilis F]
MAWRCSGSSNKELVENLFRADLIKSSRVRDAMMKVDRAHYCPDLSYAYEDSPQSISHAATISAPHMHASAAESLLPYLKPGARVLDVGSGSGYLTAVLAELVYPQEEDGNGEVGKARVVGLEHIKALRDMGEGNTKKSKRGQQLLGEGKVSFVVGDGRKGWSEGEGAEKGWDAIHVGAAAVELHQELVNQLRSPGRIFIPVEDPDGYGQHIWTVDKDANGVVTKKKLFGVRYVPLTDAPR